MPPESLPSPYLTLQIPDRNTVTSFESSFWETAAKVYLAETSPRHYPRVRETLEIKLGPQGPLFPMTPLLPTSSLWLTAFLLDLPQAPHPQARTAPGPSCTHSPPTRQAQESVRFRRRRARVHHFCGTSPRHVRLTHKNCLNYLLRYN